MRKSLGIEVFRFLFRLFFGIFLGEFFWIFFCENAERSGATSEFCQFVNKTK
jgi:hypothetical protein